MSKREKKPTQGGARTGAGRPASAEKNKRSKIKWVRVTPTESHRLSKHVLTLEQPLSFSSWARDVLLRTPTLKGCSKYPTLYLRNETKWVRMTPRESRLLEKHMRDAKSELSFSSWARCILLREIGYREIGID